MSTSKLSVKCTHDVIYSFSYTWVNESLMTHVYESMSHWRMYTSLTRVNENTRSRTHDVYNIDSCQREHSFSYTWLVLVYMSQWVSYSFTHDSPSRVHESMILVLIYSWFSFSYTWSRSRIHESTCSHLFVLVCMSQWVYMIDWCCFDYFGRKSLVSLLEALCARSTWGRVSYRLNWLQM